MKLKFGHISFHLSRQGSTILNFRTVILLPLVTICVASTLLFSGSNNQAALAATGTVTGTVFNDKNSNGTNDGSDAGVSGVVVTAYDSTGAQVGTATSAGDGTYSLTVSSSATAYVRSEFTTPNGYESSFQGAGNGTSIQFVSLPATNVNYGVLVLGNFCQISNPTFGKRCLIKLVKN